MQNKSHLLLSFFLLLGLAGRAQQQAYVPTADNLRSRQEFADSRFGIFIHWGIYSLFGQGEWYMHRAGINRDEYAMAADAFYPHRFNAQEWVSVFKESGAGYITFTTRHHDGFSMWDTNESEYNIVDATPFGRDVVGELANACHEQGMRLHFYYSHLDWRRDDYPLGRTGHKSGRDPGKADWPSYYRFMNNQLTELLTRYGKVGAIWFDGMWDHDSDTVPFDWQLSEQYALIHRLQPQCLIGNNHHLAVNPGEDIQIFERDLPGENKAGFVQQAAQVSRLPLETCNTMNGMWGYKADDTDYKPTSELLHYLIRTAGKGANLLLNVGPLPNGELPAAAVSRLKEMGRWMADYGPTIRGTEGGDVPPCEWGATTRRGKHLYVHVLDSGVVQVVLPPEVRVRSAKEYRTDLAIKTKRDRNGTVLKLHSHRDYVDYVIDVVTK